MQVDSPKKINLLPLVFMLNIITMTIITDQRPSFFKMEEICIVVEKIYSDDLNTSVFNNIIKLLSYLHPFKNSA